MTENDGKSWIQDIATTSQNEGALKAAWKLLQDFLSLGGNYRVRFIQEQLRAENRDYETILGQINLDESLIKGHILAIGGKLNAASTMLDKVHDLLSPLGQCKVKLGFSPHGTDLACRATNRKLERFTAMCEFVTRFGGSHHTSTRVDERPVGSLREAIAKSFVSGYRVVHQDRVHGRRLQIAGNHERRTPRRPPLTHIYRGSSVGNREP